MENNPKTVLITNVHSSRNIGDQALLESSSMILRMAFGKPRLLVSVNWPDEPYFKQADGFETFPSPLALVGGATNRSKWKQALGILRGSLAGWLEARGFRGLSTRIGGPGWNRLFQAYRDADLVVGVPGNIFLSTGKFGWPFLTGALSVELAHWFRKPFYVLPQSIGPLKRNWERKLLRSIYGRARKVFLRDQISLRLAEELGIPEEKVTFAPDPAFALPVENQTEALAFLARYGYKNDGHNIGATIISPMGRFLNPERLENYYTTVARALDRLASEYQVRIFLFNQVTGPTAIEDDRLAVEKLLERIPGDLKRVSWVNETLSPALLSACYGQMQLFIASRLHSGIFALSMGVPTLFIGFLTKTRGVMEAIGLENWVVDFSFLDEAKLWERLQSSWLEKEAYAARLQEILPPLKKSVLDISEWISKDYEQYQQENSPRSNH